ncbi:MAG TPA: hypothetical protein VFN87_21115 [Solirubrobacteraceae bacterium]|nr:hypothetical protein [Solirubrobacteraceae bacterium]
MLAVAAFIAFWVIIALGLFLIAVRPGRGRARGVTRSASRSALVLFAVTVAVFGIALPLIMLIGNSNNANANVGGLTLTAAQKSGRELFGERCGVCHTLAAANAVGKVGPNLDQLRPSVTLILHTLTYGCLPNAPAGSNQTCLGQGVMPAGVVTGRQAQNVASYVAKVAGQE